MAIQHTCDLCGELISRIPPSPSSVGGPGLPGLELRGPDGYTRNVELCQAHFKSIITDVRERIVTSPSSSPTLKQSLDTWIAWGSKEPDAG